MKIENISRNYSIWIKNYILSNFPSLKIKIIITRMPSFEKYSAYVLTDSEEHLFLTLPNFWYTLISDDIHAEEEKTRKLKTKI